MMKKKEKIFYEKEVQRKTGKLKYTLTNDYLFKVFLQRNKKALKGLLSALLCMDENEIISVEILNPIQEGESIDDKTMILDIKLVLNQDKVINIEMQVRNDGDWPERSLGYLCRAFDQLNKGDDYLDVKETIHIGILDFTPRDFPQKLFLQYYLSEKETHHIYSRKFHLKMLQLNQLGNPSDEEQMPDIYYWAALFKETTWEEVYMLAERNETMKECIVTLKELTEDEKEQMRMEGRERYEGRLKAAAKNGEMRGEMRGESNFAELAKRLLADNRIDDLQKATEDEKIREELYKECQIK